ncbi:MAG: hypothetical protein LBJ92_00220 [Holosporales bacterium]|nr:hypothetical protein [Holosporales bacterium]
MGNVQTANPSLRFGFGILYSHDPSLNGFGFTLRQFDPNFEIPISEDNPQFSALETMRFMEYRRRGTEVQGEYTNAVLIEQAIYYAFRTALLNKALNEKYGSKGIQWNHWMQTVTPYVAPIVCASLMTALSIYLYHKYRY